MYLCMYMSTYLAPCSAVHFYSVGIVTHDRRIGSKTRSGVSEWKQEEAFAVWLEMANVMKIVS
jgi:hypothetical protein